MELQQRDYRHVVQNRAGKDEKMPDPVKVFPFREVEVTSRSIDNSAENQIKHGHFQIFRPQNVKQKYRKPAHEDIQACRKTLEFEREARKNDAGERKIPYHDEKNDRIRDFKHEHEHRRVGPCDQKINCAVVDSPEDFFRGFVRHCVIAGRRFERNEKHRAVNRSCRALHRCR